MTQAAQGFRVVVLTCGSLGTAAASAIARLDRVDSVLVVRAPYRTVTRTGIDRLRHALRYGGVPALLRAPLKRVQRLNGNGASPPPPEPAPGGRTRTVFVEDFTDPSALAEIRAFGPTLGVIAGTPILPPEVFSLPELGSINLHSGKAPEYRGSAPAFWEMYNGEARVGVTVHWVEAEVDAGPIIRQEMLPFNPAPPGDPIQYIREYRERVLRPAGLELLVAAVQDIIAGTAEAVPQDHGASSTYRLPTYRQRTELRRRVAARRNSGWRRQGKRVLGWLLFRSGLYRRLTEGKAFIVLFHRVDDRYELNPISCTTQEFERYCAFFARYFDVIPASELVDRIERGEDLTRRLVITFDDGYADNVAAAETMRRHGLTGCFFVATEYIGSQRDGPWDVEQGHHSYWMTWDDVRKLVELGCEVGSHTMNHVDLGVVSREEAVAELSGSRATLEERLGRPVHHFGYPFGGRDNITAENVDAVKECGYRTCMSAYGGAVTPDSDLFNLQRFAVSPWHRSPWQLGLELLLDARSRS